MYEGRDCELGREAGQGVESDRGSCMKIQLLVDRKRKNDDDVDVDGDGGAEKVEKDGVLLTFWRGN